MSDPQKKVEAHWVNYVKPLLEAHGEDPSIIEKYGFHYISSGVHFYKHALEDNGIDPNKRCMKNE